MDRQKCKTYDGALGAGYYASLIARAAARLSSDESVDGRRGDESVSSEHEEERDHSDSEAHFARTDCIWQVLKGDVDGVKVSRLFEEGEQAKPKAFFLYAQQFNNGANMDEHGPASMFSIGSADGPTMRLSSRVATGTISALISSSASICWPLSSPRNEAPEQYPHKRQDVVGWAGWKLTGYSSSPSPKGNWARLIRQNKPNRPRSCSLTSTTPSLHRLRWLLASVAAVN